MNILHFFSYLVNFWSFWKQFKTKTNVELLEESRGGEGACPAPRMGSQPEESAQPCSLRQG